MRNTRIKKCLSCILAASLFWNGTGAALAQEEAVIMLEDENISLLEENEAEWTDDTVPEERESEWTNDTEEVLEADTIQILDCEEITEYRSPEEVNAVVWNVEPEETNFEGIEIQSSSLTNGTCGDAASWTFDSTTGLLTITGEGTIVGDKNTTSWYGLNKKKIQEIVIKEGITKIGDYAFYYCSALESIEMPESLISIGDKAFACCDTLKIIEIPEGVISIGEYAFQDCRVLELIELPETVTSIGKDAFMCCRALKSIEIPEGITKIKEATFSDCIALETIKLPKGVTSIGYTAFQRCRSLKSIELPEDLTNMDSYVFSDCSALELIKIPEGVTSIASDAFSGCSSLKSIELHKALRWIGSSAFSGCSSLEQIELPEGLTRIENSTFSGCSLLEQIKLPERITRIGKGAFSDCTAMKSIEIPKGVTTLTNVFDGCTSLTSIKLPASISGLDFSTTYSLKEIYTYAGTYAATYAMENGYAFIDIGMIEDALNAIPALEELTLDDIDVVSTARTAYNKVNVQEYIESTLPEKLFAAEEKLSNFQIAADAEAFIKKCLARPDLTTTYRMAVETARERYDQLTATQQSLFDTALYAELLTAEASIAALDTVTMINEDLALLPEASALTLADKDSVEALKEAYDALSKEQQKQIASKLVEKLNAAVARIAELEAVEAVKTAISLLPELAQLTLKDKEAAEAARAAYDALSAAQQAEVGMALLECLKTAEARLKELQKIAAVEEQLLAIPKVADLTLNNQTQIEAGRSAYDALSELLKAQISSEALARLSAAEQRLADLKEVAAAERAVTALLSLPNLTTTNRAAVETVRLIYDALTQTQQSLVDPELIATLLRLEAEIAEQKKLEHVQDTVSDLPEVSKLSAADKASVTAIRAAYDALSEEQKQQMDSALLEWLLAAEARMAELEKAAEHVHSWGSGTVTKAATCAVEGIRTYQCSCGETKTETIAISTQHTYGSWQTAAEATVSAAQTQKRHCSICGAEETQSVGAKLTPILELPGKLSTFNMKKGTTSTFTVTMANGDSAASVKSNKTAILKATLAKKTGKITLKAVKTGTAKLTIKLASGKSRTYTVKVVTSTIKTTAVTVTSVTNKKLTLAKGKTHTLKTELKPFTSTQKLTYTSSDKKIATVTAAGKIKAVAAGKATITVKSGSKSVKITVTVPGITNVKSSVTVKKGKTLTLSPKTYGISEKVTYTSSDTKIATVTSKGKIKGIKKGTTKITIIAGSYKQTVIVKVN